MLAATVTSAPQPPAGHYDPQAQLWEPRFWVRSLSEVDEPRTEAGTADVLILAGQLDPHVDLLVTELRTRGATVIRIDPSRFCSQGRVCWQTGGKEATIRIDDAYGRYLELGPRPVAGFYRRSPRELLPAQIRPDFASQAAESEASALVANLADHPSVAWLNAPAAAQAGETKLQQIQLAASLGMRVPRTLVTNDPEVAIAFARELGTDIAIKPIGTTDLVANGDLCDFYTRRVTPKGLADMAAAVGRTPALIQEFVAKRADVRVTIVGSTVFAVEITPAATARDDWRRSPLCAAFAPVELPDEVTAVLLRFLAISRLGYGAFDLARRMSDGALVFLENNPNGGWSLIEERARLPITAAIADALIA